MRQASKAAVLALAMLAGASTGAAAEQAAPVVVELYTSQGCSSCPPADAILAKLTKRKDLIAMSLPVTYWDMLGWKDTLASEANTRRQKAYAAAMRRGGVYTPQLIVDGVKDVVGSREDAVEEAIDAAIEARQDAADAVADSEDDGVSLPGGMQALRSPGRGAPPRAAWSIGVDLTQKPQHLRIAVTAAPTAARTSKLDATVWLFRVATSTTVRIKSGENAGRTMTYRNVVNDIRDVGRWRGTAMSFDVPRAGAKAPPHDAIVVVVQQGGYGRVIGAAYINHAEYYAQQ